MADSENYGARSDQSRGFHMTVYETVQRIPYGRVTTYGHIAKLIGAPENSRQVGFALKHLPRVEHFDVDNSAPTVPEFHIDNVPWQRVLGAGGKISMPRTRYHQIVKLREEIPVDDDGSVSLAEFGWFPDPDTWDLDNELASET